MVKWHKTIVKMNGTASPRLSGAGVGREMMVRLLDKNYAFIARGVSTPYHIARRNDTKQWQTLCGRRWKSAGN